MKKFLNSPQNISSMKDLDGFAKRMGTSSLSAEEHKFVRRRAAESGKVARLGRRFGAWTTACRLPWGLACWTQPAPAAHLAHARPDGFPAAEAMDPGAGVVFIVKNFGGDEMNCELAVEMPASPV